MPAARAGWIIATGSAAGIVVAPVVGVLADRFGRRVVLTSCLVVFGVAGTSAVLTIGLRHAVGRRVADRPRRMARGLRALHAGVVTAVYAWVLLGPFARGRASSSAQVAA